MGLAVHAMGLRKSTAALTEADWTDLRDAFAAAYRLGDERGYAFHAGLHGLPLPTYCQHGTVQFLTWHRAHLYFFERALTDALRRERGDQSVTVSLPWWDWTSAVSHRDGLPSGYLPADGADNPLAAGPVTLDDADLALVRGNLPGAITDGPSPVTIRDPGPPGELPRQQTAARALRAPTFSDFSRLLEGIHNGVHGWVGGAMSAVPIAAYDPVFWAHHTNIDRLWSLWQLNNHPNFPPSFLDRALPPFPMTVRQTLDVSRLGYDYASSTTHATVS